MDMDMNLFQPDDIPSQQGGKNLICSCPKCSAKIELELAPIDGGMTSYRCPECKTGYVLTRESFARRASRHVGEINCAHCGGQLDHSQYCPSCKALYPDYYAAEPPDAAKKRARQSRDLFGGLRNISFNWGSSQTATVDYQPVLVESEVWQEPVASKKRSVVAIIGLVVIVAVVAAGFSLYNIAVSKKKFVSTYVMTLYGLKVGTDIGLQLCNTTSADWTAKGLTAPPRISVDDENKLNNLKVQTDKYLQQLNDPPSAFAESNEKLKNLNGSFLKVYAMALTPSGSPATYIEQVKKAENEFKAAAADIKKSLPQELAAEVEVAKNKYRAMKDF